jgi:hypothetical protein
MRQTPRSGTLATRSAPPAIATCRSLSLSDSVFLQHPDQHRSQRPILSCLHRMVMRFVVQSEVSRAKSMFRLGRLLGSSAGATWYAGSETDGVE